ncbi:hypothetical protein B0F90DRAFT_1917628 [Multifurca ochricompacta]|uniref:Uncharacterized protein n=1 Tax=Multifurca ochricompacta TaxID=376703 RepID=A0AAD4QNE2_9AGAM|nr:hypothetical protein B0F90DRAFT_1917628 [Multifurca ochricompacta]
MAQQQQQQRKQRSARNGPNPKGKKGGGGTVALRNKRRRKKERKKEALLVTVTLFSAPLHLLGGKNRTRPLCLPACPHWHWNIGSVVGVAETKTKKTKTQRRII